MGSERNSHKDKKRYPNRYLCVDFIGYCWDKSGLDETVPANYCSHGNCVDGNAFATNHVRWHIWKEKRNEAAFVLCTTILSLLFVVNPLSPRLCKKRAQNAYIETLVSFLDATEEAEDFRHHSSLEGGGLLKAPPWLLRNNKHDKGHQQ